MNAEFVQGAYNPDEHAHAHERIWPTERLEARIANIRARMAQIAYSGERLAQNERELDLLSEELGYRYQDSRKNDIEQAWREHGEL